MKHHGVVRLSTAAMACILVVLPVVADGSEIATFESIYKTSSAIYWGLAAVLALVAAAVVFFTGGTSSPIVVSIGTWVGGFLGLSGAAATNAGLALLGGGSIAAGGFGMVGGAALVTTALTFSTNVVFDFALGKAVDTYQYAKFVDASQQMTTLPLPKSDSGPKAYQAAMKILTKVDAQKPLWSAANAALVKKAIGELTPASEQSLDASAMVRQRTLLAVLHFVVNNYREARRHADYAYREAHAIDALATLPAFIYATSTLYEPEFDIAAVNQDFRYSISGEPDNPLTPVLFAIYLDRMMYRFNDGYLSARALDQVAAMAADLPLVERKTVVQIGLASRYFIRLKVEQQRVMTLAQSRNPTIRDNPGTLQTVEAAFSEYSILLQAAEAAVDKIEEDLARRHEQESRWLKRMREKVKSLWNNDAEAQERMNIDQVRQFRDLWNSYSGHRTGLRKVVDELAGYQASLKAKSASPNKPEPGPGSDHKLHLVGLLLLIVLAGLGLLVHALRSRTRTNPGSVRTP